MRLAGIAACVLLTQCTSAGDAHRAPLERASSPILYAADGARLTASGGAAYDQFGVSVAMTATTAVIGANAHDTGGKNNAGAAYVFVKSGSTWTLEQKLVASDGVANDQFGYSVAVAGDTIVVGARDVDPPSTTDTGAAYVFTRTGTTWTQRQKLLPPTGAATKGGVGHRVAIEGDVIVVSSALSGPSAAVSGTAFVYQRSGSTWSYVDALSPPVATTVAEQFGCALALGPDRLLVGARTHDGGGKVDSGGVYVYARTNVSTFTLQTTLHAADAQVGDNFGTAVAIDGSSAVIGAFEASHSGKIGAGAAYVFTGSGATWTQQAKLVASDAVGADLFGESVAISGDVVTIGASRVDAAGMNNAGAAYPFQRVGTTWTEQRRFVAFDGAANDEFGHALAMAGDAVLVSALVADVTTKPDAGAAYVYRLAPSKDLGAACASNLECTGSACVDGVCCNEACVGPCRACSQAKKGSGADGTCGSVAADTNPRSGCTVGAGACAADGLCDGAGSCRSFAKVGTSCGPTTCAAASVMGKTCKGDAAECIDAVVACAPYGCAGTACARTCTADGDCAASSFCTSASTCSTKRALGASCGMAKECVSGFCADGVCCNSACTGGCEVCNDTPGTCKVIGGAPRVGHGACGGTGTTCSGTCDGVNGATCTYPIGKECSAACAAATQSLSTCDATGACVGSPPQGCNGFACEGTTRCKTTCASASDCAPKFTCVNAKCEPVLAVCSDDGAAVIEPDGKRTECGVTRCKTGACVQVCAATDDCAVGHVCNVGRCESARAQASEDAGGCASSGRPARGPLVAWSALALALLATRRRTRSSPTQ